MTHFRILTLAFTMILGIHVAGVASSADIYQFDSNNPAALHQDIPLFAIDNIEQDNSIYTTEVSQMSNNDYGMMSIEQVNDATVITAAIIQNNNRDGTTETGRNGTILNTLVIQGHVADVRVGNNSDTPITQPGIDTSAVVDQQSNWSAANIMQDGDINIANIEQWGSTAVDKNIASIDQRGNENYADIYQEGDDLWAEIIQSGNRNYANIYQAGSSNIATITQSGSGITAAPNQAYITQMGNSHHATINQAGGAGNYASIFQSN